MSESTEPEAQLAADIPEDVGHGEPRCESSGADAQFDSRGSGNGGNGSAAQGSSAAQPGNSTAAANNDSPAAGISAGDIQSDDSAVLSSGDYGARLWNEAQGSQQMQDEMTVMPKLPARCSSASVLHSCLLERHQAPVIRLRCTTQN